MGSYENCSVLLYLGMKCAPTNLSRRWTGRQNTVLVGPHVWHLHHGDVVPVLVSLTKKPLSSSYLL